jgi:hypothetical protein
MVPRADTVGSRSASKSGFYQFKHCALGHIFLCLLAFHLLVAIEKTLLNNGVHASWATARDTVKTHQVSTVVLPAKNGGCVRADARSQSQTPL